MITKRDGTREIFQRDVYKRQWLQTTKYDIESFVILDDDTDMCEYTSTNLVKTSNKTGLTAVSYTHLY